MLSYTENVSKYLLLIVFVLLDDPTGASCYHFLLSSLHVTTNNSFIAHN